MCDNGVWFCAPRSIALTSAVSPVEWFEFTTFRGPSVCRFRFFGFSAPPPSIGVGSLGSGHVGLFGFGLKNTFGRLTRDSGRPLCFDWWWSSGELRAWEVLSLLFGWRRGMLKNVLALRSFLNLPRSGLGRSCSLAWSVKKFSFVWG